MRVIPISISALLSVFLQNEVDGMTGNIRFDKFGRRSHFKLDVVEYFMGHFQKVGWWETGHGVTRTQSDKEKEAEIQKSLQSKTFIVSSRIVSYVTCPFVSPSVCTPDVGTWYQGIALGESQSCSDDCGKRNELLL